MHSPLAINDIEVATIWWISVAVAFVVVVVAVGLLTNIVVTLKAIDTNVNTIWTVGKRIANNTVQLWLLGRVVSVVTDIKTHAYVVNDVAGAIASHAVACTHCPACVSPHAGRPRIQGAMSETELQGSRDAAGAADDAERPSWSWRPFPQAGQ